MKLSAETKIDDLLKEYPFLTEYLIARSQKFRLLQSTVMRKTVGRMATLNQVAAIGGIELGQLLDGIAAEISARTGLKDLIVDKTETASAAIDDPSIRHELLKDIIRDLHAGTDMSLLKQRFSDLIKDIDPSEIARMEQKLIEEGMPEAEVKRLCDVHVKVFGESLVKKDKLRMPAGHPVHTFMLENRALENIIRQASDLLDRIGTPPDGNMFRFLQTELLGLIDSMSQVDIHFLRKENQLFPALETHKVSGPSSVMWALHDDIRNALKAVRVLVGDSGIDESVTKLREILQKISDMIYKEENILFPMAAEILTESDWAKVRKGEEEIGYAWVTPEAEWTSGAAQGEKSMDEAAKLSLDTGMLTMEQVNLMLTHMPLDLSFVDENDEVAYYSQTKERIFPRSPGVIGRKVQNCHPPKSMPMVQRILDEFRSGKKDAAEFWIQMKGRFLHIRYFAVRGAAGNYKGCLEVSQDVTDIKKLEGQKRLLDWE